MDNQPILSLCIPTNGAVEWILPVIESIYLQGYDSEKFEVVITDNCKDSQLPAYIAEMDYPNLRYKQTTDEGFLNLVRCLKEGKGLFCKMINHRSVLLPCSIADMVELVERYKDSQPIIYCSDGALPERDEIIECSNTDTFIKHLSYFCSWSAGIGLWQKDLENVDTIKLNEMFPNTSLLLEIRQSSKYVIWNKKYEKMEDDAGKGGYDLFHTFAVILPDILSSLLRRNRISQSTFDKFKKDLFRFLCSLYTNEVIKPTKHTFIICDVKQNITRYYGNCGYWRFIITAYIWTVYAGFSKLKRFVCH